MNLETKISHAQNDNFQFTISAQTLNPNLKLTITRPVYGPFLIGFPLYRVLTEIVTNTCSKQKGQTQNVFVSLGIEERIMPPRRVTKAQLQCTISRPREHWIFTRSSWQNNFFLLFRIGFPQTGPHQSHENYTQANASLEERTHDDGVKLGIKIERSGFTR